MVRTVLQRAAASKHNGHTMKAEQLSTFGVEQVWAKSGPEERCERDRG